MQLFNINQWLRWTKLSHIYITNKTHDRVNGQLIVQVIKKAIYSVTSLVVSNEIVLSNWALLQLFELTNLTSLEQNGENLCSKGASKLANLTLLKCLKIRRIPRTNVTEKEMINLLSKLNNLKTVELSGSIWSRGETDMYLSALANNNPNLRYTFPDFLDDCYYFRRYVRFLELRLHGLLGLHYQCLLLRGR